ncbi:MAG TPA: FKBP-type peptidyl-prolyl cis-trans isomerase [Bdellovibrionales bacterium]|nr:FKBP-type peptidyl-prolyl cis-trans isomerase [Bdellovibrionales bacterium]
MKPQIVSFHCVLKTKLGKLISSTLNHEVLTCLPDEVGMLPGLAEGMRDIKSGEKRRISLNAAQAYGYYDPKKVITCPREGLDKEDLRLGESLMCEIDGKSDMYRVTELRGTYVTLDGNHPLAGQDLVFEIEALDVRDASPEDLPTPRFH